MVNILSEKRFGDSERSWLSPRDWSLSLSLLAERWCRESLGVLEEEGREWSPGLDMDTTGIGVSRLTSESAASLLIVNVFQRTNSHSGARVRFAPEFLHSRNGMVRQAARTGRGRESALGTALGRLGRWRRCAVRAGRLAFFPLLFRQGPSNGWAVGRRLLCTVYQSTV